MSKKSNDMFDKRLREWNRLEPEWRVVEELVGFYHGDA